ncbi:hypothetical protein FHG87_007545 [Trinorchestia longiramus]|nr:hypothetical protein FHG87_007545 [Trinorchestia longiramus]
MSLLMTLRSAVLVLLLPVLTSHQHPLQPERCVVDDEAILCTCDYDQELVLQNLMSWMPERTSSITVSDCRLAKVWVGRSDGVLRSFFLQQMIFRDLNDLIFESDSVDFNLPHDNVFILNISRVNSLTLDRGAVRLSGAPSAIIISDASVSGLPAFAIESSSLKLFKLHGVVFTRPLTTAAVLIESSDSVVDIDEVNARDGLLSGWIHGRIASLAIKRSRLLFYPEAFAQLSFSDVSIKTFSLRESILLVADNSTSVPRILSEHQEQNLWVRMNKNQISCQSARPEDEARLSKLICFLYSTSRCLEPNRTLIRPSKCRTIEADKSGIPNTTSAEDFFLSITL